jgi:hypothetical protein
MLASDLELVALLRDFLEQTRIVHGNGRLRREGRQQANHLSREGSRMIAPHNQGTDHFALMQERDGENGANAGAP